MLEAALSTLGTTSGHCARPPGLDTHMPGRVVVGNQATSPGVPSRGLAAGRPPEISASGTGASWVGMGVGAHQALPAGASTEGRCLVAVT